MTPEQFIDALFGEGWKPEHLPVFLEAVKRMQEYAQRYLELREFLAKGDDWLASRESLNSVDDHIDAVRQSDA